MNAPTNELAETDPLKIEPPSSDNINANINSINTASKNVNAPMVSFGNPSNLETELDLGTITDPNNVKTELSKDKSQEKEAPEMEGNDDPYDTKELDEENVDDNDWCAICHDGGDTLYCCDRCPKVYHLFCYIPPLTEEPPDDWVRHFFVKSQVSLFFNCH